MVTHMKLDLINDRNREIFRSIVETYLETGDPVGSRTLSKHGSISVSPATIRNVMSDLEEAGLILAPHTSAGRVPTDLGLRLFVDGMLEVGNLTGAERASIEGQCNASGKTIENTLAEASKMLSGLSHCASVVIVPKSDIAIKHIEFVPYTHGKALVVLVAEDGSVENRIIDLPLGLPQSALTQASNYLNARLVGRTLPQASALIEAELMEHQAELDTLTAKVVESGIAIWSGSKTANPSLIVSGQANLLDNVTAMEDMERIRHLFEDLESKKELINMLDLARDGRGVRMFIGSENNLFSLSGSSLVVSPYISGANKIVGVIGVIGPTRLNYARIIPMVDYTAKVVSRLL